MSEIILYYTLGGTCKKYAENRATEDDADVQQVLETKKRGMITAFCPGALQAMSQKSSKIIPIEKSLDDYDKIVLVTPIWAGHQVPAMNSIAALIPQGKEVEIVAISGQGSGYGETLANKIKEAGGQVSGITNIKSGSMK